MGKAELLKNNSSTSNNSTVDLTEESSLKPKPESNSTTYSTL